MSAMERSGHALQEHVLQEQASQAPSAQPPTLPGQTVPDRNAPDHDAAHHDHHAGLEAALARAPRETLDTLIASGSTMAGISLALVGVIGAKSSITRTDTITDDLCLLSALGFVIVCFGAYLGTKTRAAQRLARTLRFLEITFACSLALLVVCGFLIVYTAL